MHATLRSRLAGAGLMVLAGVAAATPAAATIDLTPDQRVIIYRGAIAAVPAPPPAVAFEPAPGAIVPETVELYPMPPAVAVEPAQSYSYVIVNRQVVLVDPATREVVDIIRE